MYRSNKLAGMQLGTGNRNRISEWFWEGDRGLRYM